MRVRSDFKKCSGCKKWLWKSKFSVDRSRTDGLYHYCYECKSKHKRQYYMENSDMINEQSGEWRIKNRDVHLEQVRKHRTANLNVIREREKNYKIENRDAYLGRKRKYRMKNLEKSAATSYIQYAIKKNGFPPPEKCIVCSSNENVHYHHESYEREHWLSVVPVCATCHARLHSFYRAKEKNQITIEGDEQIAQIVHEEFLFLCKGEQ